jgi:spoIIIJ-associated protein
MTKEESIKSILENMFGFLQVTPAVDVNPAEENVFNIVVEGNNLNALIGFRGYSLQALEDIMELMLFREFNDHTTIVLDINGYKAQRIERIQELARKLIDKVRFFEKDVEMPPMDPWERRQVHIMIGEYDDVVSESTGVGPNRRVILKSKKKGKDLE